MTLFLIPPATVAAVALGLVLGVSVILPLLCALPACLHLWHALARGRRGHALAGLLLWAATLGACCTAAGFLWEDRAARVILNGPAYAQEMRSWIVSGVGAESTPRLFIPQHIVHLSIFCALALITGGAAALVMGSVLMGYMSFYVGTLARAAQGCAPAHTMLLAWNPWSLVRIVSFIVLGVALAEPLVARAARRRGTAHAARPGLGRWILVGLAGVLADILLKALLAPSWRGMLASCLG